MWLNFFFSFVLLEFISSKKGEERKNLLPINNVNRFTLNSLGFSRQDSKVSLNHTLFNLKINRVYYRGISAGCFNYQAAPHIIKVKITDIETNFTIAYDSISKASKAINLDIRTLKRYISLTGDKNKILPLKNRYHVITEVSIDNICLKNLEKGKVFFFESDKKTLAYVFDNCWQAARTLTPKRSAHFTDKQLKQNKNLQYISRVINKGVLTTTEKGKFYVFINPVYSDSLALVSWGINLKSTVNIKRITKQEKDMIKLPNLQLGIIVGILLSDGRLACSNRAINYALHFKQSLSKSSFLWFVFSSLSHYCSSYPYFSIGVRNGTKTYALSFFTRTYPFFTELHKKFYIKGKKIIPFEIYELLSPAALAHMIMGDGCRNYGLEICTDCYSLPDVIRLLNVLVIRYRLNCTVRLKRDNQYRLYISSKSMPNLRTIVGPYMHSTMMYKVYPKLVDTKSNILNFKTNNRGKVA